jgi:hypothetical protein
MHTAISVATHFSNKGPELQAVYDALLAKVRTFGEVFEAPRATSINLQRNTNFAGVHPRQDCFNLEFRTSYAINHPRILSSLQISANRIEHTVQICSADDVDDQLIAWLKDSYELSK